MTTKHYAGRCHCGAVRFAFRSEPITSGRRCNCSICVRKGGVMSSAYIAADDFELSGADALAVYQFGGQDVRHCFCTTCGISPFTEIASLPSGYAGPAKVGDRRVNLGCVDEIDVFALEITILDGRAL